jgi:hypothetical protein
LLFNQSINQSINQSTNQSFVGYERQTKRQVALKEERQQGRVRSGVVLIPIVSNVELHEGYGIPSKIGFLLSMDGNREFEMSMVTHNGTVCPWMDTIIHVIKDGCSLFYANLASFARSQNDGPVIV